MSRLICSTSLRKSSILESNTDGDDRQGGNDDRHRSDDGHDDLTAAGHAMRRGAWRFLACLTTHLAHSVDAGSQLG